jgi:threonine/homoserine/homoserine lactone efflux protein
MFGIHDLTLFIISGLLLNIMPGPDSLLIMTRSATQGWRAGVAATAGIGAGTFVHVFAAALGLSAILATSATAFMVVKYIGAAYILYMAIGLLRSKRREAAATVAPVPPLPYRKIFAQGFLTNVLNPKVAIFFLAFVPQFIDAGAPAKALAFIILGCIFNINGMLWCTSLALFTAFASSRLQLNPTVSLWLNRVTGGLFIWLGIKLALSKQS